MYVYVCMYVCMYVGYVGPICMCVHVYYMHALPMYVSMCLYVYLYVSMYNFYVSMHVDLLCICILSVYIFRVHTFVHAYVKSSMSSNWKVIDLGLLQSFATDFVIYNKVRSAYRHRWWGWVYYIVSVPHTRESVYFSRGAIIGNRPYTRSLHCIRRQTLWIRLRYNWFRI